MELLLPAQQVQGQPDLGLAELAGLPCLLAAGLAVLLRRDLVRLLSLNITLSHLLVLRPRQADLPARPERADRGLSEAADLPELPAVLLDLLDLLGLLGLQGLLDLPVDQVVALLVQPVGLQELLGLPEVDLLEVQADLLLSPGPLQDLPGPPADLLELPGQPDLLADLALLAVLAEQLLEPELPGQEPAGSEPGLLAG